LGRAGAVAGEPAFLTLTENRYVPIQDDQDRELLLIEHWDAQLQKIRYAEESTGHLYGASVYRPERTPAVITIRQNAD